MKSFFTFIFITYSCQAFAQNADNLIRKVGSFPENYVNKTIQLDKIYVWFRLEVSPADQNNERFYKVTLCDSNSDCFSKLGIKTEIIVPIVKKKLALQLINDELSNDEYKYISRITGKVLKKKLGKYNYVLLISTIEIYNEDSSEIIDIYK